MLAHCGVYAPVMNMGQYLCFLLSPHIVYLDLLFALYQSSVKYLNKCEEMCCTFKPPPYEYNATIKSMFLWRGRHVMQIHSRGLHFHVEAHLSRVCLAGLVWLKIQLPMANVHVTVSWMHSGIVYSWNH